MRLDPYFSFNKLISETRGSKAVVKTRLFRVSSSNKFTSDKVSLILPTKSFLLENCSPEGLKKFMFLLNKFFSTELSPDPKEQIIEAQFKKTGAFL